MSRNITFLLFFIILIRMPFAQAQYAGDVYFSTPSVAVEEGEEIEVDVLSFTGATPFGASQVKLNFNSEEVLVTEILPGSMKALEDGFATRISEGEASFVAINSDSLSEPFGTVELATVKFRTLSPAGSRIFVESSVEQILGSNSVALPSSNGFGLEITVIPPGSSSGSTSSGVTSSSVISTILEPVTSQATVVVSESTANQKSRAEALRRQGSRVTLIELDENLGTKEITVQTKTDGEPSE